MMSSNFGLNFLLLHNNFTMILFNWYRRYSFSFQKFPSGNEFVHFLYCLWFISSGPPINILRGIVFLPTIFQMRKIRKLRNLWSFRHFWNFLHILNCIFNIPLLNTWTFLRTLWSVLLSRGLLRCRKLFFSFLIIHTDTLSPSFRIFFFPPHENFLDNLIEFVWGSFPSRLDFPMPEEMVGSVISVFCCLVAAKRRTYRITLRMRWRSVRGWSWR